MGKRFNKTEYFTHRPATDLYRMVLQEDLMVKMPSGMAIPIDKIVEQEALERARRIINEHIELKTEQEDTEKRLRELSMSLVKLKTEGPLPV